MKRWLGLGLVSGAAAVLLGAWLAQQDPPQAQPLAARSAAPSAVAARPAEALPAPAAVRQPATVPALLVEQLAEPEAEPAFNAQEAQMLMQLMADQGDPRSPALGQLKARQQASPALLADPKGYSAFEEQQSLDLVMAYAGGVRQIPEIRERIEQAAQSGERTAEEIDEARAALQQLEMLQSKLQREAPQLLPGAQTSP